MKRFLFKFFFVLMALIAAIPAQAKTVFFKNNGNWNTVKAHIWNGTNGTSWPGKDMTNLGDGWWCVETGDCKNIIFNGGSDNQKTSDLTIPTDQKECAYNNSWNNWTGYTLYLNHPWNGGGWSWKEATNNYDGTFSLVANYGGNNNNTGCDYGYTASKTDYVMDENADYVIAIPKGTECTFTFDRRTKKLTITKNIEQLAAPTFSPEGGTFTSAQSVTISATDGATIHYTTDGSEPSTSSAVYDGNAITISTTTTLKAIAMKDGYANSEIASATYTIKENPSTGECYFLPNNTADNAQQMTKNADGSFTITVDIAQKSYFGFATKATTEAEYQLGTNAGGDYWYITSSQLDKDITLKLGSTKNFYMEYATGKYTITISADYSKVKLVKSGAQAGGIPVFPLGVNSEAELKAYDFEANPVYYLLSTILNNNRVTPEWQMTKGADGLYHLNGFAMRNTSCRDTDGGKNIEGYIKVRQYVDATSYEEFDKQQVNDLPTNPLTDGKLYNATFDPETQKLTLTEDASAKGKMPFISLVGYMMQQDQEYTTPRGIDGKPSGTNSSQGWQEAWLQYDANGKLLKDRAGNVMYSTTWPPKNPIYFTATVNEQERQYSSDQMTFVPVKDAEGNYVAKKGSEWEEELKALDSEAYKKLDLVDDNIYYRYVVSDIWYVGAGKIWTGWGSQITYSDNKPIAQWYNHTNWGYLDKRANDTDGSPIDPETTYGVSTEDKKNGNFLFEEPTYFKTFEFFYENNKPSTESKIYTTKAYGSASIAAQNVKDGDSYKKGSYQPTVSVPDGVTITGWTITRHDATTDVLAPIGSDNGLVASGEATDPSTTTFTLDNEGLGEGRYYYELTVTFDNGRTATVRSNPFVIYFPNQYSLDANGYQLVKLDNATDDGYSYVTYNAKANGDLYFVKFEDSAVSGTVSEFRVATSAERESLNGKFAKNEGIKWTDKVFVYAPVPSEFKIDAEKASATVSLDQIYNYDVNNTKGVNPVGYELAVVDLKQNFANKVYKAVMNYKEKDATTGVLGDMKSSLGKENLTVMRMPNVKGGDVTVSVTPTENSEVLSIDYNGTPKNYAANYYNVNVELPFSDPNVEAAVAPQYEVKVTDSKGATTKLYKASGTDGRAIKFLNVNPLEFAGKSVEVNAKYSDGTGYNLDANIGEAAKIASGSAAFEGCTPSITAMDAFASKFPVYDANNKIVAQKDVIVITKLGFAHEGANDNISGKNLNVENALYNADFTVESTSTYSNVYELSELNFAGSLIEQDGHHVWSKSIQFDNTSGVTTSPRLKVAITPFYVAQVTNTEGADGLVPNDVAQAPVVKAEATTYVALPCETANAENGGLATGIVDITEGSNMKAYKVIENGEIRIIYGDRKFNVMGAEVK